MRRILILALLLGGAGLLAGCGSEPPAPGDLVVTSEPPGADIMLDGEDTGQSTPHTFADLEGGVTHTVSVSLDGWNVQPGSRTVEVPFGSKVTVPFTLSQGLGSLAVTSDPAGAAIRLDGALTGELTPFTFEDLAPGDHTVAVELAYYTSVVDEITATVEVGTTATADFDLGVARVVLFEGFSNVYCVGCPTMNANVDFVMHQPGYGRDRLLYLKWPAILSPLDPFYWVTQAITNARVDWYFGSSQINLPTLTGDGSLLGGAGTPLNSGGMMDFVDGQPVFAEVIVMVETDEDLGDVADLSHAATVTLLSPDGVDLTGHRLDVALVYESVETENEGYIDGVTEFHWVMRDHVNLAADLGMLTAGVPYPFPVTLDDPLGGELNGHAVYPHHKQILAWVQHAASRAMVQAGSTVSAAALEAAAAPGSNPDAPVVHHGGSR